MTSERKRFFMSTFPTKGGQASRNFRPGFDWEMGFHFLGNFFWTLAIRNSKNSHHNLTCGQLAYALCYAYIPELSCTFSHYYIIIIFIIRDNKVLPGDWSRVKASNLINVHKCNKGGVRCKKGYFPICNIVKH